jgi:hypothetical protein
MPYQDLAHQALNACIEWGKEKSSNSFQELTTGYFQNAKLDFDGQQAVCAVHIRVLRKLSAPPAALGWNAPLIYYPTTAIPPQL